MMLKCSMGVFVACVLSGCAAGVPEENLPDAERSVIPHDGAPDGGDAHGDAYAPDRWVDSARADGGDARDVGDGGDARDVGEADASDAPVAVAPDAGNTTCPGTQIACDGACTDTSADSNNCGACGVTCDAHAYCANGACGSMPAPRLVAPLSTSTVTSQTPTLRWSLPAGVDGVRIQVCRDRACSVTVATIDSMGAATQVAVTPALPSGTWFWRAFGRVGSHVGLAGSRTWQFTVGHRSAPHDGAWGSVPDFDGDGFSDVTVGAGCAPFDMQRGHCGPGRVYYYPSRNGMLAADPTVVLTGTAPGQEFGIPASAGDVDGDGFADLIVGAVLDDQAYLYRGSTTGPDATSVRTLHRAVDSGGGRFGSIVEGLGDINGDGYADVAVGSPCAYLTASRGCGGGPVYIYYGSPQGLPATESLVLSSPTADGLGFGAAVSGVGDVNGDGFADLLVGAAGFNNYAGAAYVYYGRATGLATVPSVVLAAPPSSGLRFGASVMGVGDINGDGVNDFVVGEEAVTFSDTVSSYVFYGAPGGPVATAPTSLPGTQCWSGWGGGDFNGDGFDDFVATDNRVQDRSGEAKVYLGSATGLVATPASLAMPTHTFDGCAPMVNAMAMIGDLDGDGHVEIAVGSARSATCASNYAGAVFVFASRDAMPTWTLSGPDWYQGLFGAVTR